MTLIQAKVAEAKPALLAGKAVAKKALAYLLSSKRFLRFAVIVLVVVGCVAAGVAILRSSRAQKKSPPPSLAVVAKSEPVQPPKVNLTTSAPSAPEVQNQSQEPPPIVTPAIESKSAVEKENSAALAQAALEKQKRQEQEARQAALEQERRRDKEKAFEQIKTALAEQVAQLSKFKSDCETRLDNNTNKIVGVARSYRRSLSQQNDNAREAILKAIQNQEDLLSRSQESWQMLSSDPQSDPRKISDPLAKFIETKRGCAPANY